MNTPRLSWLDRLLIKISLAKAAARGHFDLYLADRLAAAFAGRNRMYGPLTSDCACERARRGEATGGPGSAGLSSTCSSSPESEPEHRAEGNSSERSTPQ